MWSMAEDADLPSTAGVTRRIDPRGAEVMLGIKYPRDGAATGEKKKQPNEPYPLRRLCFYHSYYHYSCS